MTTTPLSPAAARRVFLALTATRWFPIGLIVGIITLWQLERGLTVAETMTAAAATGFTVFALELPTSGFADAFGRRPVLIASALVGAVAAVLLLLATTFWAFLAVAVLTGVFRALDSGPLEAWYVDTVHETSPGAEVDGALAAQGTVVGVGIAVGALASGALIWWDPVAGSALRLPVVVFAVLTVAHLLAVVALLREPRTHDAGALAGVRASVRKAPVVVRDGLGMLRTNRVLRGVVLVEVFWAVAMIVFETFQPIRLAELVGGEQAAGALMGPVAAGGWGIFALGSALAGLLTRRLGVARTAIVARVLNGLGAVVMGLVAGPAALLAAYAVTYMLHGTGGPPHAALLHREARAANRSTVLSMNSMTSFAAFAVASPLLGLLAERTSVPLAMATAGAFSVVGAAFYLPALRAERERRIAAEPEAVGLA